MDGRMGGADEAASELNGVSMLLCSSHLHISHADVAYKKFQLYAPNHRSACGATVHADVSFTGGIHQK